MKSVFHNFSAIAVFAALLFTACVHGPVTSENEPNTIHFEQSEYGLIFTDVVVNGMTVRAMIDFGDSHILQLSSTIVDELGLEVEKADYQVGDVYGNVWDVYSGMVDRVAIGSQTLNNVEFSSQPGEMESVSEQIATRFDAVLGWRYFGSGYTTLDYAEKQISISADPLENDEVLFSLPFDKDSAQLIISASNSYGDFKLMIDTGTSVNVFDSGFMQSMSSDNVEFSIADQSMRVSVYTQDLSVLADLGVVGILGGEFLDDWVITIDPEREVLLFSR